jgi:hypothetical protein
MSTTMTMPEAAALIETQPEAERQPLAAGEATPPGEVRPREASQPSERDYDIYRASALELKSQSELAVEFGVSQQRISQIVRNVERWMAAHPDDEEAQRMRVRVSNRWEALFDAAMRSFQRSQNDHEVVKQRTSRRASDAAGENSVNTTTNETTVRRQNGDVRFLQAAIRITERQQKLWEQQWEAEQQNDPVHLEQPAVREPAATEVPVPSRVPVPSDRVEYPPALPAPWARASAETTARQTPTSPTPTNRAPEKQPTPQERRAQRAKRRYQDIRVTAPQPELEELLARRAKGMEERVDFSICGPSSSSGRPANGPIRIGAALVYNLSDVPTGQSG